MKARTKKFGTRAVAMLLSAMTAFSMFPVSAGAAQVNSYHGSCGALDAGFRSNK